MEEIRELSTNPKVSICIPCYEMNGKGVYFLKNALDSIKIQDYKNREVVISDHSVDNAIEDFLKSYEDSDTFIYVRNERSRGNSSANFNNSFIHASGEFIKPLCQDDVFLVESSLRTQVDFLTKSGKNWLVSSYIHQNEQMCSLDTHIPSHSPNLLKDNLYGCPSGVLFKNTGMYFDENLIYYSDTEFYHRYSIQAGDPFLLYLRTMKVTRHPNQVTNTLITRKLITSEEMYIQNRYHK